MEERDFSLKFTDLFWNQPNLAFNGYRPSFWGQNDLGVMLSTHLDLRPTLRMNGARTLLPIYASILATGKNSPVYCVEATKPRTLRNPAVTLHSNFQFRMRFFIFRCAIFLTCFYPVASKNRSSSEASFRYIYTSKVRREEQREL